MKAAVSLSSFDATEQISTRALRPETYRHLLEHVSTEKVAIARGAGLSYSAASFGSDVVSIDLTRFDRILSYELTTEYHAITGDGLAPGTWTINRDLA